MGTDKVKENEITIVPRCQESLFRDGKRDSQGLPKADNWASTGGNQTKNESQIQDSEVCRLEGTNFSLLLLRIACFVSQENSWKERIQLD